MRHTLLNRNQRLVIKIGSALLTANGQGLAAEAIAGWVQQICAIRQQGIEVVLVSSGAVAAGLSALGMTQRPSELHELQAAAAVGQMGLVQCYESQFKRYNTHTAQILLTHDDLSNRCRYLNARSTLKTLLSYGIVPIINENDTVVTDEICFGDNDMLAALVANLLEADALIILTDQLGLFDKNPNEYADAALIKQGVAGDSALLAMAQGKGTFGKGGMASKLNAATMAARSGAATVIASGQLEQVLSKIVAGEEVGTLLTPLHPKLEARKLWMLGQLQMKGALYLDGGAVKALTEQGKSLLPVGVCRIQGRFQRGDLVRCMDESGHEIARGLVNYSATETQKIQRCSSQQIATQLGYINEPELIHRDNLVLLN